MSTKPSTVPLFAQDANYPAGPEPEAGKPTKADPGRQDIGYRPNEKPGGPEHNWLFNLLGQWAKYLSDGVLTGGIEVDTLKVDGTSELVGDVAIGGSVDVEGGFQADGVVRIKASLTFGAAKWISGGVHTQLFGTSGAHNAWRLENSTQCLWLPLPIGGGSRLKSYVIYIDKQTSNVATVSAKLYRTRAFQNGFIGTENPVTPGSSFNGNSTGAAVLTETVDVDIAAGYEYYLVFNPSSEVSPGKDVLYSAEIAYETAPLAA